MAWGVGGGEGRGCRRVLKGLIKLVSVARCDGVRRSEKEGCCGILM